MLVFFKYYNDAVQRHEQRCCWDGSLDKLNIIINIDMRRRSRFRTGRSDPDNSARSLVTLAIHLSHIADYEIF